MIEGHVPFLVLSLHSKLRSIKCENLEYEIQSFSCGTIEENLFPFVLILYVKFFEFLILHNRE